MIKKFFTFIFSGAARNIPELKLHGQLCIMKIDYVSYVDELTVTSNKTFNSEESAFFEKQVKSFLYSSFPLGAPFTLNIGSKINLPSFNNNDTTFTVQSYKSSEDLCDTGIANYADIERSVTIPSQLVTIDECEGSLISVTDKVSKLQISSPVPLKFSQLEEAGSESKFAASLITSTPKKAASSVRSECSNTPSSVINTKEISLIKGSVTDSESGLLHGKNTWVRTGINTKIILQQACDEKADVSLPTVSEEREFCKDGTYYTLKKIMETACSGSDTTGMHIISIIIRKT